MAKKHVISYYLEHEKEYLEVLDEISELETLYKDGKMDYDRYSQIRDTLAPQIEQLKAPYELLSYVVFLLNIPNSPKKGKKYEAQNKMYYAYFNKFQKEGEPDISKDTLANFKAMVRKFLEENKNEG